MNNRAFAFKLKLNKSLEDVSIGQNVLFIWGIGNEMVIKGVKALEEQTGLKAVALMTNGGGHHLFLKHWYDNFPSMRIWVCPTKVPMTVNGQRLQKEYASRWELVDNTTVPHHAYQLLDYFGVGDNMQVDCVVFNQFMSYDDKTSGEAGSCQWIEGHKPKENVTTREFMKSMGTLQADMSCRTDDIMFFHKPTNLLITGHHYEVSSNYRRIRLLSLNICSSTVSAFSLVCVSPQGLQNARRSQVHWLLLLPKHLTGYILQIRTL